MFPLLSTLHAFSRANRSLWSYLIRPRRVRAAATWGSLFVATVAWAASGVAEKSDDGWSADLLNQILRAEAVKAPAVAEVPAKPAEMVLRTYQLSHLHVAESGKAQNVLAILGKLLPPGSSMNPEVATNSLHILTTTAAHAAIWDYLSAVDVAAPPAPPPAMPDDVKTALQKLAQTGDQSARVLAAIGSIRTEVSAQLADIEDRQHRANVKLALGAGAFALVLLLTGTWMVRRRAAPAPEPADGATLALGPDQLAAALVPAQDKMRNDMLGMLNEVAIKLQAQHHEQQKLVREQQDQLESARQALADERRQFITEAGTMVVQAVERVDATTAKLARQQDKVSELVHELQHTVRELDDTKDKLRDREVELEQERAKIAALSLLLEEGAPLPSGVFANGHHPEPLNRGFAFVPPASQRPCMTPEPHPTPNPQASSPAPRIPPESPPARFTFLPPDQAET